MTGSQGDRSRAASIRLRGLAKRFGQVQAVHALDLEVERGELLVLLGPSGCGKSTVLRMIAGVEEPTEGEVWIGDRRVNELEPAERDVAMVFQSYALYPHMKVRGNLAFGLKMRGVPRAEIDEKVRRAATMLGLGELLERRPGQLSGGQRQRVALGRAMVREPSVFLFDEPLSNLDARLRQEMRTEIAELHGRLGATMVFVTHDQVEAMSLGQRVAVMNAGRLQQCGPPMGIYRKPANLFVARFIGSPVMNTVEGTLEPGDGVILFRGSGVELRVGGVESRAGPAVLGVRPEAIRLTEVDDSLAAYASKIRRTEPLGSEVLIHIDGPGGAPWVARLGPEAVFREGDGVGVALDAKRVHLFDGEEGARLRAAAEEPEA